MLSQHLKPALRYFHTHENFTTRHFNGYPKENFIKDCIMQLVRKNAQQIKNNTPQISGKYNGKWMVYNGKSLLKLMIWGYHYFWKHPCKPKEYPNSNDMMGRFLQTGFVWLRHVNNSRNLDPRRRLGGKCKAHLAEPSKDLFMKQQPFGRLM